MALTWNTRSAATATDWYGAAAGLGLVIFVSDEDFVAAVLSNNGVDCDEYATPTTGVDYWANITFDGTCFVLFGKLLTGNLCSTSTVDGQSYTAIVDLGVANIAWPAYASAAANGRIFTCPQRSGGVDNEIFVTDDHGATVVSKHTLAPGVQADYTAYNGTVALCTETLGGAIAVTSTDNCDTWIEHAAPANFPAYQTSLFGGPGYFLAGDNSVPTAFSKSTNGAGWALVDTVPGTNYILAEVNDVVAIANMAGGIESSADQGATFAPDTATGGSVDFYGGIGYQGRLYFAEAGTTNIYVSDVIPYHESLSDTFGCGIHGDGIAAALLQSTFGLGGEVTVADIIKVITSRIELGELLSPRRERFATLVDEMQYSSALAVAWHMAITSGMEFSGQAQGNLNKFAAIIDTLQAIGAVTNRVDAMAAVTNVLAVNALLATGWKVEAMDTIAFQDALSAQLTAITKLVDTAAFAGVVTPALRITAIVSDSLALDGEAATSLQAFEALSDRVLFHTTLRLGDAEYTGWVFHGGAVSEYRNYPFNGMIRFAGDKKYYGTADSGLYVLEGETDDGDPIDAWIKTALMDFGTGKLKRVPDVYVAFIGGSQMLLKVITTERDGQQVEDHYTTDVPAGTAMHNGRIKVGRGIDSRYWQYELRNVDGAAFELDEIAWRPLILDKRI